jgi:hypothetical protein
MISYKPIRLSKRLYDLCALLKRHVVRFDCRVLHCNNYTLATTTSIVNRQSHVSCLNKEQVRPENTLWMKHCKPYTIGTCINHQRRSVSYFEDHIDLTKQLFEISKIDEDNIAHSYLKIDLEREFLEIINGVISDFKVQFEEASRPTKNIRYNGEWAKIIPLDISPFPVESMQSVLLFDAGDTFCKLPSDKLIKCHRNLTNRLNKCGFLSDNESPDISLPPGTPTSHWYIRVKEFKLAPKDKLNTIIAILQPSPYWKHLHKQIQGLAGRTSGLVRTLSTDQCNEWLPSLPIAHVYNGMAGRTKYEILLKDLLSKLPFHRINVSSKIQTISMGGTIPTQVPTLSWNFHFHGRPLLELRERTNIQDSLPETFFDTSYDDDHENSNSSNIMDGNTNTNANSTNIEANDVDDITDDQLIEDPLESYVVSLEDIDFHPREDGTYRTYDDVDAFIKASQEMSTSEFDEEIDTDDVFGLGNFGTPNNDGNNGT